MANETAVALKEQKKEIVDMVISKIEAFQKSGELVLPPDYAAGNALNSAWLIIQETTDLQKRPALEVCTKVSVSNALLSMAIQGLNPDKSQCYFIVYGNKLQMKRSYFGSIAVTKRVTNGRVAEIIPEVIYEGDIFEYTKKRGKNFVTKHEQKFENIKKENIKGAYAIVVYDDDTEEAELMTMDQVKQAWAQSKMKVFDDKGNLNSTSTHAKFTEEMAKKTVVNRVTKKFINTSDDSSLLIQTIRATEDDALEAEAQMIIDENANQKLIDIDPETGEVTDEVIEAEYTVEEETPSQEETPAGGVQQEF